MKNILDLLKREWELTIFGVVVVVLFMWALTVFLSGGEVSLGMGLGVGGGQPEPLVREDGLSFLEPMEDGRLPSSRPFGLPDSMLQPLPKPPAPTPVPKKVEIVKPVVPKKQEEAPKVEVKPEPVKVKPKGPNYAVGVLFYAEAQELANGTRAGLLELSRGEDREALVLGVGETKYGLNVVRVTDRMIQFYDAKRRPVTLKREDETKVWVIVE